MLNHRMHGDSRRNIRLLLGGLAMQWVMLGNFVNAQYEREIVCQQASWKGADHSYCFRYHKQLAMVLL